MKKLALIISLSLVAGSALADTIHKVGRADHGEVIETNVCGSNNLIVYTRDYWFVAVRQKTGNPLPQGETVYGFMKLYGLSTFAVKFSMQHRKVFIEGYEVSLDRARARLCEK